MWGKRGESLCQYLAKGSKVTVTGELSTEEYNGKTKLKIRVNDVALQGNVQRGQEPSYQEPSGGGHSPDLDDEIPFAPCVL